MYNFSNISRQRLNTCHPRLQQIANEAIKYIDFSIVTGHRTKEEQDALYPKYTKLKWPRGKHNSYPSLAIDIMPYIPPFGTITGHSTQITEICAITGRRRADVGLFVNKAYARLIGTWEGIAQSKFGYKLRVGLDWNGNFNTLDQTFDDLGHIEIVL